MNIFTTFFYKILAKYSPKRTILKKLSRGSIPPNPPSKRVASRHANTPTFQKNIWNPPPRNEILDTAQPPPPPIDPRLECHALHYKY